jgi:hypothetical protein
MRFLRYLHFFVATDIWGQLTGMIQAFGEADEEIAAAKRRAISPTRGKRKSIGKGGLHVTTTDEERYRSKKIKNKK